MSVRVGVTIGARALTAAVCKEVSDGETGVTISTLDTDGDEDFEFTECQLVGADEFSECVVGDGSQACLESLNSVQPLIKLLLLGLCLIRGIDISVLGQVRVDRLMRDEILGELVDIDAVLLEPVAGLDLGSATAVVIDKKPIEIFKFAVEM